ncbi:DUF4394 domain-containing protein [Roseomonas sp. USHLN139]|uniref:DUF4394 domain-containing protein n=1 Tax=Roseomonas sp. USHLN139 TaxID=3081298 RepID=UPI003B0284DB
MSLRPLLLTASALIGLGAAPLSAATLLGLTADNQLVRIDSETRQAARPLAIRGVEGRLLGIDQRPADGRLYGVSDAGQIVTIDPATGRATQVARLSEAFAAGGRAVVDFNPVADRLRLMGMNGVNFRVHPDTGAVTRDGTLKYQAGPLAETTPRIAAGAYTSSVKGATATQLFTIDTLLRQMNLQAPPNDGVQQPKGEVAASLPAGVAFDILTASGGGDTAFLLAGGTLHSLSLETGRATMLGPVARLPAAEVIDIAAWR